MATRKQLEALKPAYLAESPQRRGRTWSGAKGLKEGPEAEAKRAIAHENLAKILRWWGEGVTIKGMAWRLKTERASVQWIIRKAIDAGTIQPDPERLRWPPERR